MCRDYSAENNTIGIRGIASNAQILPINICPNDYFANDLEIAKAIRWASERADVLSCSWGGNGGSSVSISEALRMLLRMEEMEKVVLLYLLQEMVLHYTTTLLIQLQKKESLVWEQLIKLVKFGIIANEVTD